MKSFLLGSAETITVNGLLIDATSDLDLTKSSTFSFNPMEIVMVIDVQLAGWVGTTTQ